MADPLLDRIKNVFIPKDSAPPPSVKPQEEENDFDEEGFREAAKSLGTFSEKEIDDYVKREKIGLKSSVAEPTIKDVEIEDPFAAYENLAKGGTYVAGAVVGSKLGKNLLSEKQEKPLSLDEIKRQNLINEEKRAQEIHDLEVQLKQNKLSAPTAQPKPIQERTIGGAKTIDPVSVEQKIAAENIKLQPNELTGHVYNKYGVTPTSIDDLKMFANQATPEMRAGFTPYFTEQLNKGVIPKPAIDAGVTPTTSAPEAQTLVATREASLDPKEKLAEVKGSVAPELKTGSGMPAIQGTAPPGTPLTKELASIGNVPSTHAFVPGGQLMDIIRNSVGQDAYTASLAKYGFPSDQKEAHAISRQINESMGRLNRDVAKDLNIGLGEPTKSISQKNPKGGKAFKLAGTTGALILMTDLANAKTDKEKREAMRNLGEAILPPSMTATEAGAPVLPTGAYSESKKLGSPFHVFPNQGRGIMPPPLR